MNRITNTIKMSSCIIEVSDDTIKAIDQVRENSVPLPYGIPAIFLKR